MAPTLHFLLLGAVAWLLYAPLATEPPVLLIDPSRVEQTAKQWQAQQGRPVSAEQREAIVDLLVKEAVLAEYARSQGLEQAEPVRQRLAKLGYFLNLVEADAREGYAVQAARAMGLHRSDPVIRNYLATVGEFVLANGSGNEAINEEVVAAYYRDHREQFRQPAVVRLSHVFVGDQDDEGRRRASALFDRVRERNLSFETAIALGDVFYGGHHFVSVTQRQLAGVLGGEFAGAVQDLPNGQWSGPVPSPFGWHLVHKSTVTPEQTLPLSAVRERIRETLRRERQQAVVARRVSALRDGYRVVIGEQG